MLVEVDGNSEIWDGEDGLFDYDVNSDEMPFALQMLSNSESLCTYDT